VSGKKAPPLIEFLVGITLKIQIKRVLFSGHPVCKEIINLTNRFIFIRILELVQDSHF